MNDVKQAFQETYASDMERAIQVQTLANNSGQYIDDEMFAWFSPDGRCESVGTVLIGDWDSDVPCAGKTDMVLIWEEFWPHYAYEGEAGPNATPRDIPGKWYKGVSLFCKEHYTQDVQFMMNRPNEYRIVEYRTYNPETDKKL